MNLLTELGKIDALPGAQVEFLRNCTTDNVNKLVPSLGKDEARNTILTPLEMGMVKDGPTSVVLVCGMRYVSLCSGRHFCDTVKARAELTHV